MSDLHRVLEEAARCPPVLMYAKAAETASQHAIYPQGSKALMAGRTGTELPECVCVCESYIGKPIGTRAVPQFTTGVAKPLTQI